MLYLFNSATRPLYAVNVLNTLLLPAGFTNEYRYRYTGDPRYIAPEMYSSLPSLKPGTECAIIFIDRYASGDYAFHPLRRASYVLHREINELAHFRVQMGEFVYPKDPATFSRQIVQALGPRGLPTLKEENPENERDGYYVIESESIFSPADQYRTGESAWNAAVESLSRMRSFETNPEQAPIFARVDVQGPHGKTVAPVLRDGSAHWPLNKDEPYNLVLAYRYPRQLSDATAEACCTVTFGDNLRPQSATVVVNSHANSVLVAFQAKRYVDDVAGSVRLSAQDQPGQPRTMLADAELPYELQDSKLFWLQLVCAFLLLSVLGAFLGTDLSKVRPLTLAGVLAALTWPKIALGFAQALVLYWLFRLIGSKVT
jgi:hypothetical protein